MNSNGIIKAPVGIDADISPVLGVGSDDLGYLCSNQHGKTNKWSRFKPLIDEDLSIHLLADYENGGTLWQGADGQCGLDIPYTNQIVSGGVPDKFFNGEMAWGYNAPEPNSKQPARALDFDGYNHYAVKPISTEGMPTDVWLTAAGNDHRFELSYDVVTTGSKYNLGLNDILVRHIYASGDNQYLNNWYLGLLMRAKNKQNIVAITNSKPMSEGGGVTVEILGNETWLAGDWDVIPFMCVEPVNTWNSEIYSKYIGIDVEPMTIKIHALGTLTYGMLSSYWIDSDNPRYIGFTGYILNSRSDEVTVKVTLGVGYNDGENPYESGGTGLALNNVITKELGTFTVPAKNNDGTAFEYNFSTKNEGGAFDYLDIGSVYEEGKTYWTFVRIDDETIPNGSYMPVQNDQLEAE